MVREEMLKTDTSLIFKMGLHNLDFFYEWMEDLQGEIQSGSVSEMIKFRAAFGTRSFVKELKTLMPGLIK
jgi:queuine/archaeosine tRNA-ribosyltransferase